MFGLNGFALFGQGVSVALIALGLGYVVCDIADKQKDFLKYLGYVIGPIIIILSLIMMGNSLISSIAFTKTMGSMGMPQQKMMQPHMPMMQPQNQTQTK